MQKINVLNKKIYFNYDDKGELVELILLDKDEFDIQESWLFD